MFLDEILTSGAIPTLEATLRFAGARQAIINHNIANLETPYFRPKDAIVVPAVDAPLSGCIEEVQFLGDRTRLTLGGVSAAGTVLVEISSRRMHDRLLVT